MGFENFEESRTKREVITLYSFLNVDGLDYQYTDAEQPVEHIDFENPFIPVPVRHGAISSSGTLDKAALEIRMPRTVELAEAFRVYPPGSVISVIIRQFHRDDPDEEVLAVWTGRVLSGAWEGDEIKFNCEPVSTSLRRSGLRRHYQIGCPHALYSAQCAAVKASATTPDIAVESVSGSVVTLPENWIPAEWDAPRQDAAKFIGGMMVWQHDSGGGLVETKRTILRITNGVEVLLAGVPVGVEPGTNVQMVLGCNHQTTDCQQIHDNIKNYGGQKFIPTKNPFGFSNQFY